MTTKIIPLTAGGHIQIVDIGNHIDIQAASGLAPGASPATMTRVEAEAVVKALTGALARLRGADAMPERAEPLPAAHERPKRR
jgi:hypothetical protein